MKRIFYLIGITAISFISCKEKVQTELPLENNNRKAVEILSSVAGEPFTAATGGYTRAWDGNWSDGDAIGVYTVAHGSALSQGNILENNKKYITPGDGSFRFENLEQVAYFPEDGSKIDIYAYYPQTEITDLIYKVDLNDQSSQEAVDLMYSASTAGYDENDIPVPLSFTHRLTKLVLNVSVLTDEENIEGFAAVMRDIYSKADFSLADGTLTVDTGSAADITLYSNVNARTVTVEGIIMPGDMNGKEVVFTLPSGSEFTWTISTDAPWESGRKYTYNVKLDEGGSEVLPNYGWFETPAISDIANTTFISHMLPESNLSDIRNFSLLYDTNYKLAYWVAYPMHEMYRGDSGRTDYWQYDPSVDSQYQPDLSSGWPNYSTLRYDRGHQLPSADRTYSVAGNRTTFYYTNMTAQNATLNQGMWASLEGKVRNWMAQCDTLYIVTGASIVTNTDKNVTTTKDNSGKDCAVPKFYYKAMAQLNTDGTFETIAFKMNNEPLTASAGYMNFALTVKELEEETGFTFFPSLPPSVKNRYTANRWQ